MKRESRYNMMTFVVISMVTFLLGILLQFVQGMEGKSLCYLIYGTLAIVGMMEIFKYFVSKAYRRLDDYSFSIGVMALILAIVGIIRIDVIVPIVQTLLIFPCLGIGLILFQFSIQLSVLHKPYWYVELICCIGIVVASILALLGVNFIKDMQTFINYLLIVSGLIGLLSYGLLLLVVRGANKDEINHPHPKAHPKPTERVEEDLGIDFTKIDDE